MKFPKTKKTSFKAAQKRADRAFQQFIHRIEKGQSCFTCGKYFSHMEAGHFISRGHQSTRYMVDNCHLQCIHCNHTLGGNLVVYRKKMIDKYGIKKVLELEIYSLKVMHRNTEDLLNIEKYYDNKAS